MPSLEVFVLMPFGSSAEYEGGPDESDCVFSEIISPGVDRAYERLEAAPAASGSQRYDNCTITREVDRNQSGSITAKIVQALASADVVVVDITGRNPNVFLELGMRYAMRSKVTVLLAQTGTQIPFDVHGYRYIEYSKYRPGEARERLAQFICEGLAPAVTSDSVVFDVIPSMTVTIPGVASSFGTEAGSPHEVMSWDDYMGRVESHCAYLEDALHDYRFLPDALIGITNGGLIAADLIGKRIFAGRDTPVLSLWAVRHKPASSSAYWYFDNEYNRSMMASIRRESEKRIATATDAVPRPSTIMIVDDHIGTGSTAVQAVQFVRECLGSGSVVVYLPIVSRRQDTIGVMEECFPYAISGADHHKIFSISKEEFLELIDTDAQFFPYLRKQVNVSTSG